MPETEHCAMLTEGSMLQRGREACSRPVGDAAAPPFRHTLSRFLVERSNTSCTNTVKQQAQLASSLRHRHNDGQSSHCGSHHWTVGYQNSPFAMGMPSCNGRLQPREVNGAL
ncbi:hypothetical protein CGLO_06818 [Colletotrichum gloeosporioides Cg-14]|uniref:Uncharacterized protein n=1 Tax=Colletotrichum gloeosporioides (strain Cg-14) TaxID=1237896 RepID=T0LYC8_COLGC|nr:hypothetical protein CGLO_06818 [Colletotrichum gloeosporioides Cg-14]